MSKQSEAEIVEMQVVDCDTWDSRNRETHEDYWLYLLISVFVLLTFG